MLVKLESNCNFNFSIYQTLDNWYFLLRKSVFRCGINTSRKGYFVWRHCTLSWHRWFVANGRLGNECITSKASAYSCPQGREPEWTAYRKAPFWWFGYHAPAFRKRRRYFGWGSDREFQRNFLGSICGIGALTGG